MNREKILSQLKESTFFKALTNESKKALLDKWDTLSEEQVRKIMFLVMNEGIVVGHLRQIGGELLDETKMKASRDMVKKLEKINASREEELLHDLLDNDEL